MIAVQPALKPLCSSWIAAAGEGWMPIEIEPTDARSPDLVGLLNALDTFLNATCGAERNHGSPVERLAQDDTQMFVARYGGQAVGCAGLQVFGDGSGEVKRMYVLPTHRGTGVGSQLLARVEEAAIAANVPILRLETTEVLPEAQALYRAKGFIPCEAYGPYIANPINLYFKKLLEPTFG
jgi:putative acetyltransferase